MAKIGRNASAGRFTIGGSKGGVFVSRNDASGHVFTKVRAADGGYLKAMSRDTYETAVRKAGSAIRSATAKLGDPLPSKKR